MLFARQQGRRLGTIYTPEQRAALKANIQEARSSLFDEDTGEVDLAALQERYASLKVYIDLYEAAERGSFVRTQHQGFTRDIIDTIGGSPALGIFVPYVTTPVNIFQQALGNVNLAHLHPSRIGLTDASKFNRDTRFLAERSADCLLYTSPSPRDS